MSPCFVDSRHFHFCLITILYVAQAGLKRAILAPPALQVCAQQTSSLISGNPTRLLPDSPHLPECPILLAFLNLQHILTVLLKSLSVPTHRSPTLVVLSALSWQRLGFSFLCSFKQLVIFITCGTVFVEEQRMTRCPMLGTGLSGCWCGGQVSLAAVGQHQQLVMG